MAGYDPGTAHDRTGEAFTNSLRPRNQRQLSQELRIFQNPQALQCPECRNEDRWRVIADNADTGLLLLQCSRCGSFTRTIQAKAPQMTDEMARASGLWVPPSVEIDIDLEN
jgi:hypothetical protein